MPDALADPFEMTNRGQHREHRCDAHAHVPVARAHGFIVGGSPSVAQRAIRESYSASSSKRVSVLHAEYT